MCDLYNLVGKKYIVYDNIIEIVCINENYILYNTWKIGHKEEKIQLGTSKDLFNDVFDILKEYKEDGDD